MHLLPNMRVSHFRLQSNVGYFSLFPDLAATTVPITLNNPRDTDKWGGARERIPPIRGLPTILEVRCLVYAAVRLEINNKYFLMTSYDKICEDNLIAELKGFLCSTINKSGILICYCLSLHTTPLL